MHSTVRPIKPQIIIAYGALAVVILMIVTGAVMGSHAFVRAKTLKVGELHSESQSIDGAGATAVEAIIVSGVGELNISGGAKQLLELDFVSNVPEMQPLVVYDVTGKQGELFVSPSVRSGLPDLSRLSEYQNEWDIRLHDGTDLDLGIVLGTGSGYFDLRGLALTGLSIEVGKGAATVDLRGDRAQNLAVAVDGGLGQTTLLLPDDVAVRVVVDMELGGLDTEGMQKVDGPDPADSEKENGVYVNHAYAERMNDSTDATLDIEVDMGTGELNLIVLDEAAEWTGEWTEEDDGQETQ